MERWDLGKAACAAMALVAVPALPATRSLSFEERLQAQWRIERVYVRHRAPQEEPPAADALAPRVERYLRMSDGLEDRYGVALSAARLQAEVDRMARTTLDPAMLRELFAALGDDPFLIAEYLGRRT